MAPVRVLTGLVVSAVLLLSGCGDDGSDRASETAPGDVSGATTKTATEPEPRGGASRTVRDPVGTRIVLAESDFGRMLFDSNKQAIYIFERDRKNRSNCYGECAEAWPPVLTEGEPRPGDGVRRSLLSTTRRRDGAIQVTYDGKPLYFYADEEPGEVKCHNVDLHGGLWWVIGADGKRRP